MSRLHSDWLTSYVEYASYTEAPKRMHFWAGVTAVAGALRRKVWMDQAYYRWLCNFYIIFVAPPGIVAKSTTADIAGEILREVPLVQMGPDIVTWQRLVKAFEESQTTFTVNGTGQQIPMAAMTIVASELGNLLNPDEEDLSNLLITLYDGKSRLRKETKFSGMESIQNIWVTLIGCTTPSWITQNIPAAMVGGGLASRCLFVYADRKEKLVAYPSRHVPIGLAGLRAGLLADLSRIADMAGEYHLSPEAEEWGEEWYRELWSGMHQQDGTDVFDNYKARKQTHIHKLAMALAASRSDELIVELDDLMTAEKMVSELEPDLPKIFAQVGKSQSSIQADRFAGYVKRRELVSYEEAFRYMRSYFPNFNEMDNVVRGFIEAGVVGLKKAGQPEKFYLEWKG